MSEQCEASRCAYAAQIRRIQASLLSTASHDPTPPFQTSNTASVRAREKAPLLYTDTITTPLSTSATRADNWTSNRRCEVLSERSVNQDVAAACCDARTSKCRCTSLPPQHTPSLTLFSQAVVSTTAFDDLIARAWGSKLNKPAVNSAVSTKASTACASPSKACSPSSSSSAFAAISGGEKAVTPDRDELKTLSPRMCCDSGGGPHGKLMHCAQPVLPEKTVRADHCLTTEHNRESSKVLQRHVFAQSSTALESPSAPESSAQMCEGEAPRRGRSSSAARVVTSACSWPVHSNSAAQHRDSVVPVAKAAGVSVARQQRLLTRVQQLDRVLEKVRGSTGTVEAARLLRRVRGDDGKPFVPDGPVNWANVRKVREALVCELLTLSSARSERASNCCSAPLPKSLAQQRAPLNNVLHDVDGTHEEKLKRRAEESEGEANVKHCITSASFDKGTLSEQPDFQWRDSHAHHEDHEEVRSKRSWPDSRSVSVSDQSRVSRSHSFSPAPKEHRQASVQSVNAIHEKATTRSTLEDAYAASTASFKQESELMRLRQLRLFNERQHRHDVEFQ